MEDESLYFIDEMSLRKLSFLWERGWDEMREHIMRMRWEIIDF